MSTTVDGAAADLRVALLHARWRWTGLPLLLTGIGLLLAALVGWVSGGSGWTVMLSCFGTGLGLASFGANHDTAMAYALKVRQDREASLPDALQREVQDELEQDRDTLLSLRPAPRVALVVPLVAFAVQSWVLLRLAGA